MKVLLDSLFSCNKRKLARPHNFLLEVFKITKKLTLLYSKRLIVLLRLMLQFSETVALRRKCLYSELFWSAFSRIRTAYISRFQRYWQFVMSENFGHGR